ncbi:hypothetical protein [Gordonia effusa]|uniref:hypothetical protein n=1 Tax=Gordonia effusa TaxID=263908 RepID=UPI00058C419A|nr:hypothetical protein [Gordonia effusa]
MLNSVVFVPSAPVLVPELAGPGAHDVDDVRAAVVDALRAANATSDDRPSRWLVCGDSVGAQPDSRLDGAGTFRGFGADRVVSLSGGGGDGPANPDWPTSMLLAGWYREAAGLSPLTPTVVDAEASSDQIAQIGASLRAELRNPGESVSVMVVADGATSLSARAPGGGDEPLAHDLQGRIDAALSDADCAALTALSSTECDRWGVGGRAVWQSVSAAVSGTRLTAQLHYAGAPLGVGYTIATWTAVS